jgi:hypothetical protein
VDYTDRLFCFGRNEEGQLNIPVDMTNDAWETMYDACTNGDNYLLSMSFSCAQIRGMDNNVRSNEENS